MRKLDFVVLALLWGCGADAGGADECRPLSMRCEGDVLYDCSPDVDLLRQGATVYSWREILVCEDDEVLGPQTCLESALPGGRVRAICGSAKSDRP
jgi:hypothetical protein